MEVLPEKVCVSFPLNYGMGATKREGQGYPYKKKGGGAGVLAMLKGWGHKQFWGCFNSGNLKF